MTSFKVGDIITPRKNITNTTNVGYNVSVKENVVCKVVIADYHDNRIKVTTISGTLFIGTCTHKTLWVEREHFKLATSQLYEIY